MKVERIDHIHIAVRDMDKAVEFFSEIFETNFGDAVEVPEFNIQGKLCPLGIELVASTSPDGAVNQFIQRRGEGLYHIAFKVPDIEQAIVELQSRGLRMIGREQMGNLKEAQFHPKDSFGVMIELAEYEEVHGAEVAAKSASSPAQSTS